MGRKLNEAPMSKFPWKTTLAVSALLAGAAYAFAQVSPSGPMGMHDQMPQGGMMNKMHSQTMQGQSGMHSGMNTGSGMHEGMRHGQMHGQKTSDTPTLPGQDAFGAIQEIVQVLQSDPKTDWSRVSIDALRQHLIDMNEVTLHAVVTPRAFENGIEFTVTGEGRTLEAIKRMVPAHTKELHEIGWNAKTDELSNGVKLTVVASEAQPLTRLKALGFLGIMVQGGHHQPHHLMIATGQMVH
jgi:hypothetical protein